MFRILLALLICCPALAFSQNRPSPVTGPADLYFLSIGVGEYAIDTVNVDLIEAERSAELVANSLLQVGARHGILLTSKLGQGAYDHVVTRQDILRAMYDLKRKIRADKAAAPRIVVYMMGHGYGDPVANVMFLAPGDVVVKGSQLTQTQISGLIHRTIWNGDAMSALVNFRMHPTMQHFDSFLPSQLMVDPTNLFKSAIQALKRNAELDRIHQQHLRNDAYAPEGNPPVPFMLLFENCFGSIEQDLIFDAGPIALELEQAWGQVVNEGLVYYAAQPGELALPVAPPPWVRSKGAIGPLAARLVETLLHAGPGALMSQVADQFENGTPLPTAVDWRPYEHTSQLLNDVATVRFLPDQSDRKGSLDIRYGSGS